MLVGKLLNSLIRKEKFTKKKIGIARANTPKREKKLHDKLSSGW